MVVIIHNQLLKGHDHRENSGYWAELAQAVFLSFKFVVYPLPGLAMTPL